MTVTDGFKSMFWGSEPKTQEARTPYWHEVGGIVENRAVDTFLSPMMDLGVDRSVCLYVDPP